MLRPIGCAMIGFLYFFPIGNSKIAQRSSSYFPANPNLDGPETKRGKDQAKKKDNHRCATCPDSSGLGTIEVEKELCALCVYVVKQIVLRFL